MDVIIGPLFRLLIEVLHIYMWIVIIGVVLSWLVAFNVINVRNPTVRQIVDVLEAITRPILWPLRRFIPPFGGMDITPVLALIIIWAAQEALVPWIFSPIIAALGG